jgi:hypothetical protein
MKNVLRHFPLIFLFICCTTQKEKIPPVSAMQKPSGKIVVYQMLTRLFGNKVSTNKPYGTIEDMERLRRTELESSMI